MITHIDGLVQDCSISIAIALEIMWSCNKPWILRPAVIFSDKMTGFRMWHSFEHDPVYNLSRYWGITTALYNDLDITWPWYTWEIYARDTAVIMIYLHYSILNIFSIFMHTLIRLSCYFPPEQSLLFEHDKTRRLVKTRGAYNHLWIASRYDNGGFLQITLQSH